MRPDVALAFDRMERAARADGVALLIVERLPLGRRAGRPLRAPPGPEVGRAARAVAAPLRHRARPRPAGRVRLARARNAARFHFVQRYAWEPWHYGFTLNAALDAAALGDGGERRAARCPPFVPDRATRRRSRAPRSAGTSRRRCSPPSSTRRATSTRSRVSRAGAQGIAQFMPGTAAALGLDDPFDAERAIDAQAHLMRDLLRRFAAVPLALAAYNAGPAPVAGLRVRARRIPETRGYVARILGLLGGAGDLERRRLGGAACRVNRGARRRGGAPR